MLLWILIGYGQFIAGFITGFMLIVFFWEGEHALYKFDSFLSNRYNCEYRTCFFSSIISSQGRSVLLFPRENPNYSQANSSKEFSLVIVGPVSITIEDCFDDEKMLWFFCEHSRVEANYTLSVRLCIFMTFFYFKFYFPQSLSALVIDFKSMLTILLSVANLWLVLGETMLSDRSVKHPRKDLGVFSTYNGLRACTLAIFNEPLRFYFMS